MTVASSRARAVSRSASSRANSLIRTIATHDRLIALLCGLLAAALAFEPRIRGGGLAADDWAEFADYRFPAALGYHSSLHALVNSAGSRVGASLYWLAGFGLFGSHTRLYVLTAALLSVLMAFSIYVLLRELRFSVVQSLAIMTLTIVIPSVATVRFWFTPSGSQLALALYFFGATLALRAFRTPARRGLWLHASSWSLYAVSACYAEVALPLVAVGLLVYLTHASVRQALVRWAADMVVVVGGYLATSSFVNETKGFVKLPRSQWAEHARLLGEQTLTLSIKAMDPFFAVQDSHTPALIALAVIALGAILVYTSRRTSATTRAALRKWGYAFAVSVIAIVVAFAVYVPAMLYYEPLGPGLATHIDIVVAAPLAVAVFSVLIVVTLIVSSVLERARAGMGRYAVGVAIGWSLVLIVTGIRNIRNDGEVWAFASRQGTRVLATLTRQLPSPSAGSTIYTFGEAGTAAPGLPVFFSSFELTNAVKVAYRRGDISAYPVVVDDDVLQCHPEGITVNVATSRLNIPSPYGKSYFFDVPSGRYERVDSKRACESAASRFAPGPYAIATTYHWSL